MPDNSGKGLKPRNARSRMIRLPQRHSPSPLGASPLLGVERSHFAWAQPGRISAARDPNRLAIGLPTFRFLPVFYQWVMRRRLMYWYAKLKALEASFDIDANAISLPETKNEIERIEDAVSHIQFPLSFTDQLYNLRSHIDIVRRKIASRANTPGSMAAE